MKRARVHSKSTLVDDYFRVVEASVSYELAGGAMSSPQRRLSVERADSAAVLVVDMAKGAVLLTRQFRLPTYDQGPGWIVEIVAGTVDEGETPEACARREALEEIGCVLHDLRPIGTFYLSPGILSERVHVYAAQVSEPPVASRGGNSQEAEDIEAVELPLDRVRLALAREEFGDAKTQVALGWLERRLTPGGKLHEW